MSKQIFKVFSIFAIVLMASNAQARVALSGGTLYYGSIDAEGELRGVGGGTDHRLLTTIPTMYILGECVNSQGSNDGGVVGAAFTVDLGVEVGDVDEPTVKNGKTTVITTHELPPLDDEEQIAAFFAKLSPDACGPNSSSGFRVVSYSIVSFNATLTAESCISFNTEGLTNLDGSPLCDVWKPQDEKVFENCVYDEVKAAQEADDLTDTLLIPIECD